MVGFLYSSCISFGLTCVSEGDICSVCKVRLCGMGSLEYSGGDVTEKLPRAVM